MDGGFEMKHEVEEVRVLNKTCRVLPECSTVWKMHRCVKVFTVYTRPRVLSMNVNGFRESALKAANCSPTVH